MGLSRLSAQARIDVTQYETDKENRRFLKPEDLQAGIGGSYYVRMITQPHRGGIGRRAAIPAEQGAHYAMDILVRLDEMQRRRVNWFRLPSVPRLDGAFEIATTQLDLHGDVVTPLKPSLMSDAGILYDRGRWVPSAGRHRHHAEQGYFLNQESGDYGGEIIAVQFGRPGDPSAAEVAVAIADFVVPLPSL